MEEWKNIEGYEGMYQVSNKGRVKSLNFNKTKKEKVLAQANRGGGYTCVTLVKNGQKKIVDVHRLVALAFIPNPNNKPEIDHIIPISEGGTNAADNLRWVTRAENNNNIMTKKKRSIRLINRTDQSKRIDQIDAETGEVIKTWKSSKDCERNGYPSRQFIRECCNGERKTYKGYIWKYIQV